MWTDRKVGKEEYLLLCSPRHKMSFDSKDAKGDRQRGVVQSKRQRLSLISVVQLHDGVCAGRRSILDVKEILAKDRDFRFSECS
jgi:hypothetical protein